jgi:hypothetical protein
LWDRLIQKTGQNVLNGTIGGNSDVFLGQSAIHEMAKEPRLARRALAEMITTSIKNFPDRATGTVRNLSFFPSSKQGTGYVFLQLYQQDRGDYDASYRPFRRTMLEIACGAAKLKFQHLTKVIGIAIDAPKYHSMNSEDFILLDCEKWTTDDQQYFEEANRELHFFQTKAMRETRLHVTDFPAAHVSGNRPKIGRNQLCPCGSGRKYKQCHGRPVLGARRGPQRQP